MVIQFLNEEIKRRVLKENEKKSESHRSNPRGPGTVASNRLR